MVSFAPLPPNRTHHQVKNVNNQGMFRIILLLLGSLAYGLLFDAYLKDLLLNEIFVSVPIAAGLLYLFFSPVIILSSMSAVLFVRRNRKKTDENIHVAKSFENQLMEPGSSFIRVFFGNHLIIAITSLIVGNFIVGKWERFTSWERFFSGGILGVVVFFYLSLSTIGCWRTLNLCSYSTLGKWLARLSLAAINILVYVFLTRVRVTF